MVILAQTTLVCASVFIATMIKTFSTYLDNHLYIIVHILLYHLGIINYIFYNIFNLIFY